ncbi:MAG TPA: polyprenyl diphosphate synthase [Roseiarcus sp.]|jgi:undecaprenyl diphosphate synthase
MHVAIIADGNGRWATSRGLPRSAGHRAGAKTLMPIVEAAPRLGVTKLTIYAFSTYNWRRPAAEIDTLMALFRNYLNDEQWLQAHQGIRLSTIGRRDRLPAGFAEEIARVEAATANGRVLHLRIALDYSAREAIASVLAAGPESGPASREQLGRRIAQSPNDDSSAPDVDLMIRTGGEKRLSDFLLWECAYAELAFLDVMWPDFTPACLDDALADYRRRERRFGGVAGTPANVAFADC